MTGFVFALPSKGRLQDAAFALLDKAELAVDRSKGGRGYTGTIAALPDVNVLLLSASEIAAGLAAGELHLGITGEDVAREAAVDFDHSVALLRALGFGWADVVIAVPESWIDVWNLADLRDVSLDFLARHKRRLRVATKYANLAHQFFTEHGLSEYRIVHSLGATEAAPSSGAADLVIDITSSGATLAANDLKTIEGGTILKSEAQLAASLKATWGANDLGQLAAILNALEPGSAESTIKDFTARLKVSPL